MTDFPPCKLEHFGVNVVDIHKMEAFYCASFGFVPSDRGVRFNGTNIVFLTKSADDHHQFVLIDGRAPDVEFNNINQISFAFARLEDLQAVYARLTANGVTDIMQINHGNAWSLYTKDPEGNPLELFVDSAWHTPQPCRGDLDITRPVETILEETEALCRSRPGFATREAWSQTIRDRLAAAMAA
ncbi:hypothetical protein BH10PSE1_BH10PSE1_32420 [soil metagenome]